jgi:hypothetical protein
VSDCITEFTVKKPPSELLPAGGPGFAIPMQEPLQVKTSQNIKENIKFTPVCWQGFFYNSLDPT